MDSVWIVDSPKSWKPKIVASSTIRVGTVFMFGFIFWEILGTTVPTQIVDAATILGFDLFGAATNQTESTIQWVYYYFNFYIKSEKMYIFYKKII